MAKPFDLLIVEDQDDERACYERLSRRRDLSVTTFKSGIEALSYLKGIGKDSLPQAYLVDMRTGDTEEELASPLEIFNFLKEAGKTQMFRFHTGHFSEHDKEVHEITNAQIIIKAGPDLDIFLDNLKSSM